MEKIKYNGETFLAVSIRELRKKFIWNDFWHGCRFCSICIPGTITCKESSSANRLCNLNRSARSEDVYMDKNMYRKVMRNNFNPYSQ